MLELKDYSDKKVLYIDDSSTNLMAGTIALENFKIKADTGKTMADLFELIRIKDYDLIILDDMMPEMKITGTEAMKRLRSSGYRKPIIVLTANTSAVDRKVYLKDGFDEHLSKPINISELDKILHKFLD